MNEWIYTMQVWKSETCCTRLVENAGRKNDAKSPSAHHRTTLSGYISSQLRHVSTVGKNVLNSNISSRCPHNNYAERWPTNSWDLLASNAEFGVPHQISTGFASCLRLYCSDVAHRKPTKLCTMFGRFLGWYIYIFGGSCPPDRISPGAIFTLRPGLPQWLHTEEHSRLGWSWEGMRILKHQLEAESAGTVWSIHMLTTHSVWSRMTLESGTSTSPLVIILYSMANLWRSLWVSSHSHPTSFNETETKVSGSRYHAVNIHKSSSSALYCFQFVMCFCWRESEMVEQYASLGWTTAL